jgi:hypothetical protein
MPATLGSVMKWYVLILSHIVLNEGSKHSLHNAENILQTARKWRYAVVFVVLGLYCKKEKKVISDRYLVSDIFRELNLAYMQTHMFNFWGPWLSTNNVVGKDVSQVSQDTLDQSQKKGELCTIAPSPSDVSSTQWRKGTTQRTTQDKAQDKTQDIE